MKSVEEMIGDLESWARAIAVEINSHRTLDKDVSMRVVKEVPRKGVLGWLFGKTATEQQIVRGWDISTITPWNVEAMALGVDGIIYATTSGPGPKNAVPLLRYSPFSEISLSRVEQSLQMLDDRHLARR